MRANNSHRVMPCECVTALCSVNPTTLKRHEGPPGIFSALCVFSSPVWVHTGWQWVLFSCSVIAFGHFNGSVVGTVQFFHYKGQIRRKHRGSREPPKQRWQVNWYCHQQQDIRKKLQREGEGFHFKGSFVLKHIDDHFDHHDFIFLYYIIIMRWRWILWILWLIS